MVGVIPLLITVEAVVTVTIVLLLVFFFPCFAGGNVSSADFLLIRPPALNLSQTYSLLALSLNLK